MFPSSYSMTTRVELGSVDALRTVEVGDGDGDGDGGDGEEERGEQTPLEAALSKAKSKVEFHMYDTPGQGYLSELAQQYVDPSSVVVLVYDISSAPSFGIAQEWADRLGSAGLLPQVGLVVGNKADKADLREVDPADAAAWAERLGYPFVELTASVADQVDAAFASLATAFHASYTDFVARAQSLA